jgi:sugar/nucleoside kinase (ribokinase family)
LDTRIGVLAAGNWIVDHIKIVDVYPKEQSLANIKQEYMNNGGAPFNVLKNLSRLGAQFPLKGFGLIGEDNYGKWIKEECRKYRISVDGLQSIPDLHTSYTDVMSVESTGRRTFFHQRGANASFDVNHINFSDSKEKIFHLAYLLLLDKLDIVGGDGLTGAARLLKSAKESGLITSTDTVSEDNDRFSKIILPSLPYVDYLFMNEFEAGRCSGIDLSSEVPDRIALRAAAAYLFRGGVTSWVFIHFPRGVFALSAQGDEIIQGAVKMPRTEIVSTVGAGDAFAAGTLWGIHHNWDMKQTIQLGVCAAAASLQDVSCSDGIMNQKDCLALGKSHSFYDLYRQP